jgi:hypothetical protein
MKASKVPDLKIGRLFHYGSMYRYLPTGFGILISYFRSGCRNEHWCCRRADQTNGQSIRQSWLCHSDRGQCHKVSGQTFANALKLGQFMSIRGASLLCLNSSWRAQILIFCLSKRNKHFGGFIVVLIICPIGNWGMLAYQ